MLFLDAHYGELLSILRLGLVFGGYTVHFDVILFTIVAVAIL